MVEGIALRVDDFDRDIVRSVRFEVQRVGCCDGNLASVAVDLEVAKRVVDQRERVAGFNMIDVRWHDKANPSIRGSIFSDVQISNRRAAGEYTSL